MAQNRWKLVGLAAVGFAMLGFLFLIRGSFANERDVTADALRAEIEAGHVTVLRLTSHVVTGQTEGEVLRVVTDESGPLVHAARARDVPVRTGPDPIALLMGVGALVFGAASLLGVGLVRRRRKAGEQATSDR